MTRRPANSGILLKLLNGKQVPMNVAIWLDENVGLCYVPASDDEDEYEFHHDGSHWILFNPEEEQLLMDRNPQLSGVPAPVSAWVGKPGEKITITAAKAVGCEIVPFYAGCRTIRRYRWIFRERYTGNVFVWVANKDIKELTVGNRLILTGSVKELITTNGEKQTVLTRCKIFDID